MKNIISILTIIILFSSCNRNSPMIEDGIIKAEEFKSPSKNTGGINYAVSEADNPEYTPTYISTAINLSFQNRNQHWQKGADALNALMNDIIANQSSGINLTSRVDLQIITYINFDQFIFSANNDETVEKYASKNLERLMKHTEPLEWNVLTKALLLASPSLTENSHRTIKNYILRGAKKTIDSLNSVSTDSKLMNRLMKEAELAINLLETNN